MKPVDTVLWRNNRISRLVLGTAQLGMPYGIANTQGQPTEQQARDMVGAAGECGITFFDTAQAYGKSEALLGRALKHLGITRQANIISKLSPELDPTDTHAVAQAVKNSCNIVGKTGLWGVLLHRPEWLNQWDSGLGGALQSSQNSGLINYLGVSVYTEAEAFRALNHPGIDIIQVPCNAWDQRMKSAGVFESARQLNKLCFVRSIYLQGLLTMTPDAVSFRIPRAQKAAHRWHGLAARFNMTPMQLAVRFAISLSAPLVIGAETVQQIKHNASLLREPPLDNETADEINCEMAPLIDESIYNPSLWKQHQ